MKHPDGYFIDGNVEWLDGFTGVRRRTPLGQGDGYLIEFVPEDRKIVEGRNVSIRAAWSCPERIAKQSKRITDAYQRRDPAIAEQQAKRISVANKLAYADLERRRALSERKKAYWIAWRLAKKNT